MSFQNIFENRSVNPRTESRQKKEEKILEGDTEGLRLFEVYGAK